MAQPLGELEHWGGGFPGEHQYSTVTNLEPAPGVDEFLDAANYVISRWQGDKFAGLYLYGSPGNGKTHAAIGLARELHDDEADVFYRYAPELAADDATECISGWTDGRSAGVKSVYSSHSVFPKSFKEGLLRNPKQVLVLDDYNPSVQKHAAAAIEAAAQYGGLLIITSNHPDPFRLTEVAEEAPSPEDLIIEEIAFKVNSDGAEQARRAREAKRAEVSASLRSRVAGGFKFIEFSGPDRRAERSFWE